MHARFRESAAAGDFGNSQRGIGIREDIENRHSTGYGAAVAGTLRLRFSDVPLIGTFVLHNDP